MRRLTPGPRTRVNANVIAGAHATHLDRNIIQVHIQKSLTASAITGPADPYVPDYPVGHDHNEPITFTAAKIQ